VYIIEQFLQLNGINEPGAIRVQSEPQAQPVVTEAEDLKLQGLRIDVAMRLKELMRKEREEERNFIRAMRRVFRYGDVR